MPTSPEAPHPLAFPIAEAVRFSGLTRTHIFGALARGQIEARKAGRRTLILGDSLRAYVARLPAASYRAPQPPAAQHQAA